jgi:hypothetical protein
MTQDELWLTKWHEAIDFLETNHRKPSKFVPEERNMRSWWKHNKKLMNAGEMKQEMWRMLKHFKRIRKDEFVNAVNPAWRDLAHVVAQIPEGL